jgi:hypothetical protein
MTSSQPPAAPAAPTILDLFHEAGYASSDSCLPLADSASLTLHEFFPTPKHSSNFVEPPLHAAPVTSLGKMMRSIVPPLLGAVILWQPAAMVLAQNGAQDARAFADKAVKNELARDQSDHARWLYYEDNKNPESPVKQWVANTSNGNLKRVLQIDGHKLSSAEQLQQVETFLGDVSAQAKARRVASQNEKEATEMLELLPSAFIWAWKADDGNYAILHFKPDPTFHPPDLEARVIAAMEGDMAVDTRQLRIASIKGKMAQDVKILGGLLGELYAGGTFDVERRETGDGIWQIAETHIHINGHVLLFKTISEQEDDVKTHFKQLPQTITMQQAKNDLMSAPDGTIAQK